MIKHFFALSIALFSGIILLAQTEPPVVLVSAKGKVTYQPAGNSAKQLVNSGAALKQTGSIELPKKGAAVLYFNGQFRQIEGKKTFSLPELFPKSTGLVQLNFDATFGEYLMAAVNMAANPENTGDAWGTVKSTKGTGDGWGTVVPTKGTGDGWGTVVPTKGTGDGWGTVIPTKGTGDGWGGKGNILHAIRPFGKVKAGKMKFHWSKPAGNRPFKVEIRNSAGELILESTTQDTFWILEPDPAKFMEGNRYEWKVSTADASEITSNARGFEIGGAADQDALLQRLEKAPLYKQSGEEVRGLMYAVSLEREEWFEEAARIYEELQKANPGNYTVRLMHAAFWMRQGLKPMAEKAYSGK